MQQRKKAANEAEAPAATHPKPAPVTIPGKKSEAPAASSSSSSSSRDAPPPGSEFGFTEDGTRFSAPETLNTMEVFLPKNMSLGSAISSLCVLTSAYLVAFGGYSKWLHIGIFFFWRLSYDLGLGLILRGQSEHKTFLKCYLRLYGDGTSWQAQVLDHLAVKQLPEHVRRANPITSYPQVFRAWLVYKNLVSIILVNDGLSYLMLGLKCFHFPPEEGFTWWVCLQYFAGVCLALFNWWAKVDAHRCIGSYCWFWGDFFFRKDLSLTFDGIFELFPHPMYTVGYSLYYGYSLIARSYTMLFVSLIAHGMQLAFLFFVEEPHIKRTYGSPPVLDKNKSRVLYDPKSGWFPDKNDNVFLLDLDVFRSGDLAVAVFCLYAVAVAFLPSDPFWALVQVVFWRVLHWFGLGAVLWAQSNFQMWTRHFTTRGRTIYEAFGHWKNTYNLSLTMNIVVFIACAVRYTIFTLGGTHWFTPYNVACFSLGLVLVSLSLWSYTSTYEAVGEFGWFYGDFFIAEDSFKQHLCYTGIYRFLNNPDCVTGYAGQYGLALMSQSWPIFFLALGSHVLNVLFLNLVEIPHMNKLYTKKELRADAPFPKALSRLQKSVEKSAGVSLKLPPTLKEAQSKLEKNFAGEVRKIKGKALEEVFEMYKKLSDSRKSVQLTGGAAIVSTPGGHVSMSTAAAAAMSPRTRKAGEDACVTVVTPPRIQLGEAMTIRFSAPVEKHASEENKPRTAKLSKSSYDWIGVYPVEVAAVPGNSDGRYIYVEPSSDGSVVFPPTLLPTVEGVYEARYFRSNGYQVVASHPFILADPALEPSPAESPLPQGSPIEGGSDADD